MWWFEGARWRKALTGVMHIAGVMLWWFRRARWCKRRRRAVVGEGFLGLRGLRVLRLKPIGIWISMGSGIASSRRQKRARCSGLPSRFILCRTCRAKAACLGGVSVCIPRAAGAAHAACSNPALCVHSEVVGRACGRTLCSLMRIDGKNKWKNVKFQLTFGNTLNIIKIR